MPINLLSHYEQVIVEPDNLDDPEPLIAKGIQVFAYVSIGEVNPVRSTDREIPESWLLAENKDWGSKIVDLTEKGWLEFLFNNRFAALWKKGYRGFFLDTLDSYQSAVKSKADRIAQERALVNLIKAIHERFPGVKLIFNRGFEILPQAASYADGIVAESLFQTWNPGNKQYEQVSKSDRTWLVKKLSEARDKYRLPVIVIDYVPSKQRSLARQTARKISRLGFTPWVATPPLDTLGVGEVEIFPRRILALYDGNHHTNGYEVSEIHRLLAMPLEYLGYTLDYHDLSEGLPGFQLSGRYAGIVTWFSNDSITQARLYRDWLLKQVDAGLKIAVFGHLGFPADLTFLDYLGIEPVEKEITKPLQIKVSDPLIGFEFQPYPMARGLTPWRVRDDKVDQHLTLEDATGLEFNAVFTASWGGVALSPYVVNTGFEGRQRWIIDPFQFLQKALALPEIPVPDVTTENGRRLLMAQVDGDGVSRLAEMPETPLAADVILNNVLRVFAIPTTVSIIEGEVRSSGKNTNQSADVEETIREIFKLDHVEIASHSYSHPLTWQTKANINASGDDYNLQLAGYSFNLKREIDGSVDYINQHLAPPEKQVRVFFWTGDGLAGADALKQVQSLGLENMNGGGAAIFNEDQTITQIPSMGRAIDNNYQIYTPVVSDHVYTKGWSGPFFGFKRVIETFQLTDLPRRLKPIHIHYHFYSGTKAASLQALKEVHRWAINQETQPVLISEYTRKVNDFQNISLARRLDGGWEIQGLNALRTLRLTSRNGWPEFRRSKGVIGVRDVPQGRYVSLMPKQGAVVLYLQNDVPETPFLLHANGVVARWQVTSKGLAFRIRAHVPVDMMVGQVNDHCYVRWSGGKLIGQRQLDSWRFTFPNVDTGEAVLVCNPAER